MYKLDDFINEYLVMEYSSERPDLHCLISKVNNEKVYLKISNRFEETGLLVDDIVMCRIDKGQFEYHFSVRILGIEAKQNELNLIVQVTSEIEQLINVRNEKRIKSRFIAFTEENNLASVINLSKSGALLLSKTSYSKGETVKVKLLISYPSTVCNFIGEIVRVYESGEGKKEYGIKIKQFKNDEEAKEYNNFIDGLIMQSESV